MSDLKKEPTLKEIYEWIAEEMDKPRTEYTYTITPEADKIFENTLKELYPESANKLINRTNQK